MLKVFRFVCLKALLSHHSPLLQPSPTPEILETPFTLPVIVFIYPYECKVFIYPYECKEEECEKKVSVSYHRQLLGTLNHGFLAFKSQVSY